MACLGLCPRLRCTQRSARLCSLGPVHHGPPRSCRSLVAVQQPAALLWLRSLRLHDADAVHCLLRDQPSSYLHVFLLATIPAQPLDHGDLRFQRCSYYYRCADHGALHLHGPVYLPHTQGGDGLRGKGQPMAHGSVLLLCLGTHGSHVARPLHRVGVSAHAHALCLR